MDNHNKKSIDRRSFLKIFGGGAAITVAAMNGLDVNAAGRGGNASADNTKGKMTYRKSKSGKNVSILGYGCMRWPNVTDETGKKTIDQETVNKLVDYAIDHGVNYFDTAPAYGQSEHATGIALHRHPRNQYMIATKLSNFDGGTKEQAIEMYHHSMKELQVDYFDFLLLHGIGMGGMNSFNKRFIENGVLDFLLEERKAGRIRNLGFSYHGDIEVYNYLLAQNDKYKWDFAQIQLNYIDWDYANETNKMNTDASYLYEELTKRNIPAVIMEPLLGGRLANLPNHLAAQLKQRRPEESIASWAFRFAGSLPNAMTVLSGMTYMENLEDNIKTFSPLQSLTEEEKSLLSDIAKLYVNFPQIPCTGCRYCMPCPYGIDIPTVFKHYNKCISESIVPVKNQDDNYRKARHEFLYGTDGSVPKLKMAEQCVNCGHCMPHCPQSIKIPNMMQRVLKYVADLKS
jgi:uncharacterized protein